MKELNVFDLRELLIGKKIDNLESKSRPEFNGWTICGVVGYKEENLMVMGLLQ